RPVEGRQGRVDGVGPGLQVTTAGVGPFGGRRVLAVVDGQVEVVDVHIGVGAVVLEDAEGDAQHVFERPEVRLVMVSVVMVSVGAVGATGAEPGQPRLDA